MLWAIYLVRLLWTELEPPMKLLMHQRFDKSMADMPLDITVVFHATTTAIS